MDTFIQYNHPYSNRRLSKFGHGSLIGFQRYRQVLLPLWVSCRNYRKTFQFPRESSHVFQGAACSEKSTQQQRHQRKERKHPQW